MAKDHIIPRFLLKGYAKNPTVSEANQKVIILDAETLSVRTEMIADAFSIRDFNTEKTEKFLAYKYENDVAKIFQRIKINAENGKSSVLLSKDEYKLLLRFFVIMWRRNDIQVDKAKKMGSDILETIKSAVGEEAYEKMLNPKMKDKTYDELFEETRDTLSKGFYDKVLPETTDDDPTVQKTLMFYLPTIIHNKSNIRFTLHNTYATIRHILPKGTTQPINEEFPSLIIEPISNVLCLCLILARHGEDLTKESLEIPIEVISEDAVIKEQFVEGYITPTATSYVVDDSNVEIIKSVLADKAKRKNKSDWLDKPDPRLKLLEELIQYNMKPSNPYANMKVGRNDLCPCGSGKKYKRCCADKYR